jgi:predicted AlkP superfamily phosphohydrolase/phosphomutase
MIIPRWFVYPSLAFIGGSLLMAIPKKASTDPYSGAAKEVAIDGSTKSVRETDHPQMVVLGIDGMDPELLAEALKLYPDRMPNFRWLLDQADGIQSLGTSTPPQSPVAWSNFITGLNPGGHGIYDFIHRDYTTRGGIGSSAKMEAGSKYELPGPWFVEMGGSAEDNRTGKAFWTILQEEGVAADIWRMPANFPVIESKGLSFPGMLTPAVDSAYGECSFYTSSSKNYAKLNREHPGNEDKVMLITDRGGTFSTSLRGPTYTNKHYDEKSKNYSRIPLKVNVDKEANAVVFDIEGKRVILEPGEWSQFIPVNFSLLPMGMADMGGICRFYLRSIEPSLEFYISPINFDPSAPGTPVSEPVDASAQLAEVIGAYYTQGMAEDVNGLKNGVLTDAEFMAQTDLVYGERRKMLEYAFDRYLEEDEGGLLFFYFSTVDLCSHMMWRHKDASHPNHDPEIAGQDSSEWSGREGSTWKDTVYELYVKMDPVIGYIRERMGDETTLLVMSDHGFASYRRKFSLNTWLLENDYLVLHEGMERELARENPEYKKVKIDTRGVVDWSKTRAYGVGFNGLYLNLEGRELDNPETEEEDESGIVKASEAEALLREIKAKLEEYKDAESGVNPVRRCDLASDVYSGARIAEAPDILVGFSAGYGNSDQSSLGRISNEVLLDNTGGTFNGSHLMAPEVVSGILLSNKPIREGEHKLEDLTVEVLDFFGIEKPEAMLGHPVLKR